MDFVESLNLKTSSSSLKSKKIRNKTETYNCGKVLVLRCDVLCPVIGLNYHILARRGENLETGSSTLLPGTIQRKEAWIKLYMNCLMQYTV